jgi:hypothetical protein
MRRLPYVTGLALDLLAGIFTLIAVTKLPLFLVQAVIASSILLTAWFERWFSHRTLKPHTYPAALAVVIGLVFVALAAHSENTAAVGPVLKNVLLLSPIFFAVTGGIALKLKDRLGYVSLGILSGTAFGCISIIGRVLAYPYPFWNILKNPLIWVIVIDGALGMLLFTAALQRSLATVVNGVMISTETTVPILAGIILLGDTARNGLWAPVWIGCTLVICGCSYIAFTG